MPGLFHRAEVIGTFLAELPLPFCMLGGHWLRLIGCVSTIMLQILIGGTGNYGMQTLSSGFAMT